MSKLLSVIVPAYNAEETLEDCLKSVLVGSNEFIEVVVVDDGSIDGTETICNKIHDDRLIYINQSNAGVSSARNMGIARATGKYLMFVDSDDKLLPDWLDTVSPYLHADNPLILFSDDQCGEIDSSDLADCIVGIPITNLKNKRPLPKYPGAPFSKIYRRDIILTYGMKYNCEVINGEDALFNLEFLTHVNTARVVDHSIYQYRIHAKSATHTFDERFFRSNSIYIDQLACILKGRNMDQRLIEQYVYFSFCRSLKILCIRAAQIESAELRDKASGLIQSNSCVISQGRIMTASKFSSLFDRIALLCYRHRLLHPLVDFLHYILSIRNRDKSYQERWVTV